MAAGRIDYQLPAGSTPNSGDSLTYARGIYSVLAVADRLPSSFVEKVRQCERVLPRRRSHNSKDRAGLSRWSPLSLRSRQRVIHAGRRMRPRARNSLFRFRPRGWISDKTPAYPRTGTASNASCRHRHGRHCSVRTRTGNLRLMRPARCHFSTLLKLTIRRGETNLKCWRVSRRCATICRIISTVEV